MTEGEICRSFRSAKDKARQIKVLAQLNGTDSLEIIKTLTLGGEELPKGTVGRLYKRLETLEAQIREREREYKAIAAVLKGEGASTRGGPWKRPR